MSGNPKVVNAFRVTRALGIPDAEIKPVLKGLLRMYDKKWELIEEDNYRTLIDAYFESKENKGKEEKREAATELDGYERPGKRLHLANGRAAVDQDHGSRTMESSKQCLTNGRAGCSSQHPLKQPNDRGKKPIAPHLVSGDRKISIGNHKKDLVIPKTEEGTDSISSSFECAVPARRPALPDLSRGSTGGNSGSSSTDVGRSACDLTCGGDHVSRPKNQQCGTEHSQADLNGVDSSCPITHEGRKPVNFFHDITKSMEKVKISLVDETGNECLPKFNYIPNNIIYQNANVNISLARISDEDCCTDCSGDCLSAAIPCACARETGGEFVYTPQGLLKEDFLAACVKEPEEHNFVYCQDCPNERSKNEYYPEKCKGHHIRKFIKECWRKCGCDLSCGNRVVQRGISYKLQVFVTPEGKGWGVRTLEVLQKGTFVCEYVGEILTNTELYERNNQSSGAKRHTYPVLLDGDWGSEQILKDDDALCLDATSHGNVARFINHRCSDANLIDIPVQVETPDRHYYHLAFFTTRKVNAFEELSWDYGIDFDDHGHPIEAFSCNCGSVACRGKKQNGRKERRGKRLVLG
ncbi:hypothetical protein FF1_033669 [Malus domestica]|uniref:histone-lysine N-methyltransferase SUVR4-like isoform X1 n=1 Tax=Malus sylvestris TaxID=3752 RepID=UPI0021AC9264|nr:histone-lysine N-methyltransferase SUVR4-like isoform X1 [Malus sylvestris]XP_050141722.1 histone-lysine N-methyltransferase SUVR4-like isoform X1 [Malus sylvestris]